MTIGDEAQILTSDQVSRMKGILDERQCEILFRRIGHGYHRIQSLSYIAKDFKLSRERIRQIQNEALVRLDDPSVTHLVLLAETKATYERNESRREKLVGTLEWRSPSQIKTNIEVQKEKHESAYDAWSEDEDARLWAAHQLGKSTQELAKLHSRSVGAIRSRLKKIREGTVLLKNASVAGTESTFAVVKKRRFSIPQRKTIRTATEIRSIDPHPSEYGNLTVRPIGKPEALLPGDEQCPSCGMKVTGNSVSCRCS